MRLYINNKLKRADSETKINYLPTEMTRNLKVKKRSKSFTRLRTKNLIGNLKFGEIKNEVKNSKKDKDSLESGILDEYLVENRNTEIA